MKVIAALALVAGLAGTALPASARDSYVMDGAGMFSPSTVSALNQQIGNFQQQTGKEVVVVTVPSLDGRTIQDAAERAFAQNQVNGVQIFLAKAERQDLVLGDRASRTFFPQGSFQSIHDAMRGYFRAGQFDQGITTGVNLVLNGYRSHAGSLRRSEAPVRTAPSVPQTSPAQTGGFSMSWIWLLLIAIAVFLIIRALFRAMAGPRMYPPGYGQQGGPGPGFGPGPGYGGPGYGYGGGGGGSFWSGLLGGLGGAFLGNELFGNRGGFGGGNWGGAGGADVMQQGQGQDAFQQQDAQGWQSDAGQADMSGAGGGGWGDPSGGGFDPGGSGGDWGGGGGFDAGGGFGGGDSGGGGGW